MSWVIHHYFPFRSFFPLLPYVVHICTQVKSSRCAIKIYLPLLQLQFKVTNFNMFCTSLTHHLRTLTLPSGTLSQQMMYLSPLNDTNILRLCPTIHQFQNPSLSISSLTMCAKILTFSVQARTCTNVLAFIFMFSLPKS